MNEVKFKSCILPAFNLPHSGKGLLCEDSAYHLYPFHSCAVQATVLCGSTTAENHRKPQIYRAGTALIVVKR